MYATEPGIAFLKAMQSDGYTVPRSGTAFVSITDVDKKRALPIIKDLEKLNFTIIATKGTAEFLLENNINCKEVSRSEKTIICNVDNPKYKIAAIDYGMKSNIYDILLANNAEVTIFPASVKAEEILNYNPDGIFLSNGPGDPSAVSYGIETVKKLLGSKPIFGICLGHQILALALEAKTFKMKFGHRGINQPVKNLKTNQIEITSRGEKR